jgi:hypothetical protein
MNSIFSSSLIGVILYTFTSCSIPKNLNDVERKAYKESKIIAKRVFTNRKTQNKIRASIEKLQNVNDRTIGLQTWENFIKEYENCKIVESKYFDHFSLKSDNLKFTFVAFENKTSCGSKVFLISHIIEDDVFKYQSMRIMENNEYQKNKDYLLRSSK